MQVSNEYYFNKTVISNTSPSVPCTYYMKFWLVSLYNAQGRQAHACNLFKNGKHSFLISLYPKRVSWEMQMLFVLYLSIWIVTFCVCTIRQRKCKMSLQSHLNFDNMLIPLAFRLSACYPSGFLCVHLITYIEKLYMSHWYICNIWQDITNITKQYSIKIYMHAAFSIFTFLFSDLFSMHIFSLFSCERKCSFMVIFWCKFAYFQIIRPEKCQKQKKYWSWLQVY